MGNVRLTEFLGFFFATLSFSVPSVAVQSSNSVRISLAGPQKILFGQSPNLQIEVVNVSDKPIDFVRPLDGSWHHMRYPHISVDVFEQSGKPIPVTLVGRCGNMNPVGEDTILRLKPNNVERFYIGWGVHERVFPKPGKYKVILTYDSRAPTFDDWVVSGFSSKREASSEVVKRLKRVTKIHLTTEPLVIEVQPITEDWLGRAISQYFLGRPRKVYAFVQNDLEDGRWKVADIRQARGRRMTSCEVLFAKEYTPPARPEHITPGYWFGEGRYLFYFDKLYLPADASAVAKKSGFSSSLGFSNFDSSNADVDFLVAFLEGGINQQLERAKRIVNTSQAIFLHYKKQVPVKDYADVDEQYGLARLLAKKVLFSHPVIIAHHIKGDVYPGLFVTFLKVDEKPIDPLDWLENMQLPIERGYRIEGTEIVYIPSVDVRKKTLNKCRIIVNTIANEVEKSVSLFDEVKWLKKRVSPGKWLGHSWPEYPEIVYELKYVRETPKREGQIKNEHFFGVQVWFKRETGEKDYRVCADKMFQRQGISACWRIIATDAIFRQLSSQITGIALNILDEYEKELCIK